MCNSISLHKCSIRGIPNPLFTNVCIVVIALVLYMAITEFRRTELLSLFLLIFSTFLTFNQCFLDCNITLVNLWKSDEVSSETLYPCFYCFTVGEYVWKPVVHNFLWCHFFFYLSCIDQVCFPVLLFY